MFFLLPSKFFHVDWGKNSNGYNIFGKNVYFWLGASFGHTHRICCSCIGKINYHIFQCNQREVYLSEKRKKTRYLFKLSCGHFQHISTTHSKPDGNQCVSLPFVNFSSSYSISLNTFYFEIICSASFYFAHFCRSERMKIKIKNVIDTTTLTVCELFNRKK